MISSTPMNVRRQPIVNFAIRGVVAALKSLYRIAEPRTTEMVNMTN